MFSSEGTHSTSRPMRSLARRRTASSTAQFMAGFALPFKRAQRVATESVRSFKELPGAIWGMNALSATEAASASFLVMCRPAWFTVHRPAISVDVPSVPRW